MCAPAATVNAGAEYAVYAVPVGVTVPITAPSNSTCTVCAPPGFQFPRWAATNWRVYVPAVRLSVWATLPVPWRKATWVPSGAAGLPDVNPLPFPLTPAPPAYAHAVPVGAYWYAVVPLPTAGASNPPP